MIGCPFLKDNANLAKVASNQEILASSGAFQNITAYLPPALQTYIQGAVGHLSNAFVGSNEFLEARGLSPILFYSSLACAALAVPYGMSRYGGWVRTHDGVSPYASQSDDLGIPQITDEDYSYITSEDLEQSTPRSYEPDKRLPPPPIDDEEDDDVLMIKCRGATYPVVFPAYSIGDGKVFVQDVRNRVALIMKLNDRRKRRTKMLYKGRQLKTQDKPIRDYGVKNNSELLLIIPEAKMSDEEDEDGASSVSDSGEEAVVADAREERKTRKNNNKKSKGGKKKKKKKDQGSQRTDSSYLNVPDQDRDGSADGEAPSVDRSRHPSRIPSPAVPVTALEKLDAISEHFESQLLPECREFIAKPPTDPKKCVDDHRKLSETVLQHVLLKLDEVETGGDQEIRARRRELVNRVQEILKRVDEKLPPGVVPKTYF